MTHRELKQKLLDIRNGGLITPLLEELWDITREDKIPYNISEWIEVGKERGYFDYFLNEKIDFLRQWLNEDRITDVKKMVSNEELLRWFK